MPPGWKNLRPLYSGGLCEAEICTPPAAPRSRTRTPTVGVAVAPTVSTSRPVAATPAVTAASKTDDETRPSWLTTIAPGPQPAGVGRGELHRRHRVDPIAHPSPKPGDARDPRSLHVVHPPARLDKDSSST